MVVFVAGSIAMWRHIYIATKNGQHHCLSERKSRIAPLGFVDVIAAGLIAFASQALALTLAMLFSGIRDFDFANVDHMTLINMWAGTAQFIAAGLTLYYLVNRYGDLHAAGLSPGSMTQDLKLGFYGFLLFVPPMLLLQAVLTNFWEYEHPTMEMISPDSSLLAILSAWWTATIVAPFSEEVIFRVVLLGWLLRCFANPDDFVGGFIGGTSKPEHSEGDSEAELKSGVYDSQEMNPEVNPYASPTLTSTSKYEFKHQKTWTPVFIVALLFAVVHIGQGPAPIPIFFLALGLCYMYRQTGSVVACIVTHFLLNTFSMTVVTIEQFYFPEDEPLTEESLAAPAGIVDFFASFF